MIISEIYIVRKNRNRFCFSYYQEKKNKSGSFFISDKECDILQGMKKIRIAQYEIEVEERKYPTASQLRIVLLSDLHGQEYGKENEQLVQLIVETKPDIILVAGDLLTANLKGQEKVAVTLLKQLAKRYPIYYVNGNHEHQIKMNTDYYGAKYLEYAQTIREAGVQLLENTHADIHVKGLPLRIYGLELPAQYYRRISRSKPTSEEMKGYLGETQDTSYNLLLAHQPMCFREYAKWGADLTVSGHLHGGFIRLPYLGGIISPQLHIFPKYDKGIYTEQGKHLVVSAGLGSHSRLPRIGNPVEIVIVDLIKGGQG